MNQSSYQELNQHPRLGRLEPSGASVAVAEQHARTLHATAAALRAQRSKQEAALFERDAVEAEGYAAQLRRFYYLLSNPPSPN
jgi:hypothetical protein